MQNLATTRIEQHMTKRYDRDVDEPSDWQTHWCQNRGMKRKGTANNMVTVTTVIVSTVMVVMVMVAFCRKSWHLGGNHQGPPLCFTMSHGWAEDKA